MTEKYHVRCTHISCGWHITARGELAAEEAQIGHEDATGHDVDIVPDSIVSFSPASELLDDPTPAK